MKRGKEARRYERHRGTDTERFAFYHMFVAAFDCDCVQGRAVETYQVHTGVGAPQYAGKGVGVALVVVNTGEHGVFHRQAPLVSEVVRFEQRHYLAQREGFLHRHEAFALGCEGRVNA